MLPACSALSCTFPGRLERGNIAHSAHQSKDQSLGAFFCLATLPPSRKGISHRLTFPRNSNRHTRSYFPNNQSEVYTSGLEPPRFFSVAEDWKQTKLEAEDWKQIKNTSAFDQRLVFGARGSADATIHRPYILEHAVRSAIALARGPSSHHQRTKHY